MNRILLFILISIAGVVNAAQFGPRVKPTCPIPRISMNVDDFRIVSTGATSVIEDEKGREWNVYIYSKNITINKEIIKEVIFNPANELPRQANDVFGAWLCVYEGKANDVTFEGSSSYITP
ncbi:hypothetical protein [Legionella saoudiensis]|uniref:hypothetical protein n=1 Tax=Legionella saoudiensis TaxID=1750561 RepID=UPI0007318AE6|nr:hypothetical protein [Legionella saoudiensis]